MYVSLHTITQNWKEFEDWNSLCYHTKHYTLISFNQLYFCISNIYISAFSIIMSLTGRNDFYCCIIVKHSDYFITNCRRVLRGYHPTLLALKAMHLKWLSVYGSTRNVLFLSNCFSYRSQNSSFCHICFPKFLSMYHHYQNPNICSCVCELIY